MAVSILPVARERILEIWGYTEKKWGVEQADRYVRELIAAIHGLPEKRRRWKPVQDDALAGVFFFRFRHHYVFFRVFPTGALGVISILHENMDLPSRLKEDAEQGETE